MKPEKSTSVAELLARLKARREEVGAVDHAPKHGFEPARNEIQWGHRWKRFGPDWHFFPAVRGQEQAEQDVLTILSSPGGQDTEAYVVFREVQYGDWTRLPEPTLEIRSE